MKKIAILTVFLTLACSQSGWAMNPGKRGADNSDGNAAKKQHIEASRFICCNETFKTFESYEHHATRNHVYYYTCPACPESQIQKFSARSALATHVSYRHREILSYAKIDFSTCFHLKNKPQQEQVVAAMLQSSINNQPEKQNTAMFQSLIAMNAGTQNNPGAAYPGLQARQAMPGTHNNTNNNNNAQARPSKASAARILMEMKNHNNNNNNNNG